MPRPVVAIVLVVLFAVPAWSESRAGDVPNILVPGGAASFARALGIAEDLPRARLLSTAIRVLWEVPAGADPAADRRRAALFDYLSALDGRSPGEAAGAAGTSDEVPGFLPPEAWSRVLSEAGATGGSTFTALLRSRRAALLYHGVAALDAETRGYLATHPTLLATIAQEGHVGLFATLGRSIRIHGEQVEPPGGPDAAPLWEAVADARLADPDDFIPRLLDRDGGRLALLYDAVAHLDIPARHFALGIRFDPARRIERFRAFYDAAGAALRPWQPLKRPFERVPFDAVHLLLATRFERDGTLPGPAWPTLWREVFDPVVVTRITRAGPDDEELCDAAAMVEMVAVSDSVERERRARTWFFAHRVFRQPARHSARELLATLKAVVRYPSLFTALERMGIQSLPTYRAAVRVADRLRVADRRLWLLQSGLALLERARLARAIDTSAADALVGALCAATPADDEPYGGTIARWIQHELFEAAGAPLVPSDLDAADRPLEAHLLAVLAGSVESPANHRLLALPPLEWEGLTYRVDPGTATLRRLVQVRGRQGGPSLDAVLALARVADALISSKSSEPTDALVAELRTVTSDLLGAGGGDERPRLRAAGNPPDLERLTSRVIERIRRLKPDGVDRLPAGVVRPLQEAVDYFLALALGSIAYAPYLGEPDSPALLAGDPSAAHDFRLFEVTQELVRRPAWHLPVEVRDRRTAWGISGSLLGLDAAMARLSLRRPLSEALPPPPSLTEAERRAFTETAVLAIAQDVTESGGEALAEALERGTRRVDAVASASDFNRLVSDIQLDEWRAQALWWTIVHEPSRRLDFLSAAELAIAGGLDAAGQDLDAWGTSEHARGGALMLRYPARLPWTTLGGRRGPSAAASLVPDLAIGLTATSKRLGLPAALTPALLLVVTQRFIETSQTAHSDDWLTMVAHARAVTSGGMEDYLAALTAGSGLALQHVPRLDPVRDQEGWSFARHAAGPDSTP